MTTVRSVFLDGGEGAGGLDAGHSPGQRQCDPVHHGLPGRGPGVPSLWSSGDIYRPKPQGSGIVWPEGTYLPLKTVFSLL